MVDDDDDERRLRHFSQRPSDRKNFPCSCTNSTRLEWFTFHDKRQSGAFWYIHRQLTDLVLSQWLLYYLLLLLLHLYQKFHAKTRKKAKQQQHRKEEQHHMLFSGRRLRCACTCVSKICFFFFFFHFFSPSFSLLLYSTPTAYFFAFFSVLCSGCQLLYNRTDFFRDWFSERISSCIVARTHAHARQKWLHKQKMSDGERRRCAYRVQRQSWALHHCMLSKE